MDIAEYFLTNHWSIVRDSNLSETPPIYLSPDDLDLSILTKRMLRYYRDGIYRHQFLAIEQALSGRNICMTTTTASGKSLVFYICGVELLSRNPHSTILAMYPLKALTDEQEHKWVDAVGQTGVKIKVGRIDGSVHSSKRKKIIQESSIVIMTPDVVHAWLMSNLQERGVINFLQNLKLVVIDEAHTYTGVFGSNAAYLFRRLQQITNMLGSKPLYISASATINDPVGHLKKLVGLDFAIIDRNEDSSGQKARRLLMVEPPDEKDVLTHLTDLMIQVTEKTDHRFITFVDSRKQTEQLASVVRRSVEQEYDEVDIEYDILEKLRVFPFRAGYETSDRKIIQDKLQQGSIRGVISTSALEMGIDIPWLTLGILFGIPYSATSYFQRIGRVGRHADGTVIVVNNGSILSNRIFRHPETLDIMPLSEGALYLENSRIQYIHAMCLARQGGEYDSVVGAGVIDSDFHAADNFDEAFVQLCKQERVGEITTELQALKLEAGNDPNHVFPLRDCEVQYRVHTQGKSEPQKHLGTLSFSQVMREAYPGAVYYYQTQPFRVVRVLNRQREILVRYEKRYTTKPTTIPTLVFPNLSEGNVYQSLQFDGLLTVECNVQIRETIVGFKERRGPNEFNNQYPLDFSLGYFFDQERFERNYFSSGVLFAHPSLERDDIDRAILAEILFEAFLIQVPFERQDLRFAADRFRISRGSFAEGSRFLCIYDQTYGSLRLSSRLMEAETLRGMLEKALEIATYDDSFAVSPSTLEVLRLLLDASNKEPVAEVIREHIYEEIENSALVIMPGSIGLYPDYNNEEFRVDSVLFTPRGLVYRGKRISLQGPRFEEVDVTVPVDKIVAIEGQSKFGCYNYDTGETRPYSSTKRASSARDTITIGK
ncbi:MAG: DEAD/DEAH box helicase [Caldilineales bacterium]|nr:DEAD/DEAH box helicase [Caldilineales bacterium]